MTEKTKKAAFGRAATSLTPDNIPLRAAYQCYFFLVGLALLILASMALASLLDKLEDYDYILDNWKQDVVTDLSITGSECQLGHIPISHYYWSGTKPGCDCRTETRNKNRRILQNAGRATGSSSKKFIPQDKIYDDHICNSTQKEYGCESVEKKNPVNFNKWSTQDDSHSFTLCAKRLSGYNFYSKAPYSQLCMNGEKECGSQDPNKFFCVPTSEPCPIVYMTFEKQNDWESVTIQDDFKIYYTREYFENSPMVEFRISEGGGVCWKNNITHISSGRSDYVLMNKKKQSCSTDSRFEQINEINEEKFYRINDQLQLENDLNGYVIDEKYQWGFYERQQILWKLSCRGDLFYDFIDQRVQMESIASNQVGLFVISLIFFLMISIVLTGVSCANIFGYDWPCISGKGTEESNKIFMIEAVIKFIVQLSHAITIIIAFASVENKITFFSDLIDQQCTDDQTQITLQDLKSVLKVEIYNFNLAQLIIFIITTFIDLFALSSFVQKFRKERQKKIEIENLNQDCLKDKKEESLNHDQNNQNLDLNTDQPNKYNNAQVYPQNQIQDHPPDYISMQQNQQLQQPAYIPMQQNPQNPAQFGQQIEYQPTPQVGGVHLQPNQQPVQGGQQVDPYQ